MRHFALALALTALPVPALAHPARIVSATLAERDTGFRTLAECEQSLEHPSGQSQQAPAASQDRARGSLFNRTHGNHSHCEMIAGEPLIVVTPNGS